MGPVRFVFFYLLAGIAALALQVAISPDSTTPTLGASGAIAGVLGGYILIYPRARVLTLIFLFIFFTFIELPAYFFLFIWFAQQAIFGAVGLTNPAATGRRRLLRPRGRLRFGLLAVRAVRETPERGLRPAEVPRLLMRGAILRWRCLGRRPALSTVHAASRAGSTSSPCLGLVLPCSRSGSSAPCCILLIDEARRSPDRGARARRLRRRGGAGTRRRTRAHAGGRRAAAGLQRAAQAADPGDRPLPLALTATADRVSVEFKRPPRSGLLFDLDTGEVLWRRLPDRVLPIASLTKMMTALIVVDRAAPDTKVRVTKEALAYKGSAVGVLPKGKRVKLETMLNGLLLPSGNDAAIALAQRMSGTVARFVERMNERAGDLGLACTRFTSPDGFEDAGNHSCAIDLAEMARAARPPRLARSSAAPARGAAVPDQEAAHLPLQQQPCCARAIRARSGSRRATPTPPGAVSSRGAPQRAPPGRGAPCTPCPASRQAAAAQPRLRAVPSPAIVAQHGQVARPPAQARCRPASPGQRAGRGRCRASQARVERRHDVGRVRGTMTSAITKRRPAPAGGDARRGRPCRAVEVVDGQRRERRGRTGRRAARRAGPAGAGRRQAGRRGEHARSSPRRSVRAGWRLEHAPPR